MKKRIISLFLVLAVSLSMFCPLAFADDSSTHEHDWSSGIISEFSDTVEGIPVSVSVKKCTKCNFYKHTYKFFGLSFDFYNVTAYTGIVDDFLLDVTLHITISPTKRLPRRPRPTLTPHLPQNQAAILATPPESLLYWSKSATT